MERREKKAGNWFFLTYYASRKGYLVMESHFFHVIHQKIYNFRNILSLAIENFKYDPALDIIYAYSEFPNTLLKKLEWLSLGWRVVSIIYWTLSWILKKCAAKKSGRIQKNKFLNGRIWFFYGCFESFWTTLE